MATFDLRRFSNAEGLKAIAAPHLLSLLTPHEPYFAERGLSLPTRSEAVSLDYDTLVEVLMNPDVIRRINSSTH